VPSTILVTGGLGYIGSHTCIALAEAGYANGFDAGDYYLDISYANVQEAVAGYLQQIGIRTKLVPRERAAQRWHDRATEHFLRAFRPLAMS